MSLILSMYCKKCIWTSRKHFGYPVDFGPKNEFHYFLVLHGPAIYDLAALIVANFSVVLHSKNDVIFVHIISQCAASCACIHDVLFLFIQQN